MSATTEYLVRPVPQVTAHRVVKPRKTKRWLDWVTTTDHKKIGIMYLVLTFVFFGLGGVEALIMRVQLARAEQLAGHLPDVQRAAHDARDDDGLPVRRAGDGRLRATTSCR